MLARLYGKAVHHTRPRCGTQGQPKARTRCAHLFSLQRTRRPNAKGGVGITAGVDAVTDACLLYMS